MQSFAVYALNFNNTVFCSYVESSYLMTFFCFFKLFILKIGTVHG